MIDLQQPLVATRRTAATALIGVVALGGVAGCGSKKSSSSSSSSSSGGAVKHYRAGEFCSKKKKAIYAAQGLHCVKGHLKKA